MEEMFFVGSYTDGDFGDYQPEGEGIYTCSLDTSTGEMKIVSCTTGISNPSYLAINKAKQHLYTLEVESGTPRGHAFEIANVLNLKPLNKQAMSGMGPCHLCLDKNEDFLAFANYKSGNVVLYSVLPDGSLSEELQSIQHEGNSVNKERQEGPHAHFVVFTDDDMLLVVDLGLDAVKRYRLDRVGGRLEPYDTLTIPAGHGPRHLVFHPSGNYLFVVNELISSISLFDYSQTEPKLLTTISTLPDNDLSTSFCAAIRIHPSGKFVYASNRGHDNIAVLSFDESTAQLELIQTISTGGQHPRDFNLAANNSILIAANQQTNNMISYWLDGETGKLNPTGYELTIGTPVCVMPLA